MPPANEAETTEIARHILETKWKTTVSSTTIAETFELAQDFAATAAPPANVLRLVETAAADLAARRPGAELTVGDILAALSRGSSVPLSLLDPSAPLDPGVVRDFFETRVLGQRDAVDTIVDRIALI